MATTLHKCGCVTVGNGWSNTQCREGHTARPGEVAAPPPTTERAARKKAEARESGRRLKPGKYRWNSETGECELAASASGEAVRVEEDEE